jgi:hypothetical protein
MITPMEGRHAITAFVDAHPVWKSVKSSLSTQERDEKQYIYFQGSEIGVVWQEGRNIYAESFWGYSPNLV